MCYEHYGECIYQVLYWHEGRRGQFYGAKQEVNLRHYIYFQLSLLLKYKYVCWYGGQSLLSALRLLVPFLSQENIGLVQQSGHRQQCTFGRKVHLQIQGLLIGLRQLS